MEKGEKLKRLLEKLCEGFQIPLNERWMKMYVLSK